MTTLLGLANSRWVMVALALIVGGCATTSSCPPLAMLDSVSVANGKRVGSGLTILRGSDQLAPKEHLPLQRGDVLTTDADTVAVVSFAGARVVLNPHTQLKLGSLLADFGEFLVSGWLKLVETKTVSAKSRGTKYHVQVDEQTGRTTVTVLEGEVTLSPKQQDLAQIAVAAGQRVSVNRVEPSTPRAASVPKEELNALTAQLVRLDKPRAVLPFVVGLTLQDAVKQLAQQGLAGPDDVIVNQVPSYDQIGKVIEQLPVAGTSSNAVTLNVARQAYAVPNLVGRPPGVALRVLLDAGLAAGQVDSSHVLDPRASVVVDQFPLGSQPLPKGETVSLTLASLSADGSTARRARVKSSATALVPDVTGATPERALLALRNAGFSALVELEPRDGMSAPRILSQDPLPNQLGEQAIPVKLVMLIAPIAPLSKDHASNGGANQ